MTDVVQSTRLTGWYGGIKTIAIISNSACASGHEIDTNIDGTADVEKLFSTAITRVIVQSTIGITEESTWDNTTGVITLGTLGATGVHNIIIEGY